MLKSETGIRAGRRLAATMAIACFPLRKKIEKQLHFLSV